jgi:hypothetical protein
MNEKRKEWDRKYSELFTMDLEEEKRQIELKRKAPRKPLSPYIFYSQEKRKIIKKENPKLTAKQIMKLVSKSWIDIKDKKELTERYEYFSLRDREAYVILRNHWETLVSPDDEIFNEGIGRRVQRG